MNRRMTRLASLTAGAALALAAFSPALAADTAMVRVLHASPDAPNVDVFLDGTKVDALTNVPFKTISGYLSIPAGDHTIKVCANADNTICPIGDTVLNFATGTKTTVAATNNLATIEAQVITDAPAAISDQTQVRVVHFSSDTPAVDVLTQDGATTVVDNLSYPNATGYLALPAGAYDLKVCADADNSLCPLDPPSLDLSAGTAYSVFAVGSLTNSTLDAVVAVDQITAPPTDTAPSSNPFLAIALLAAGIVAIGGAARLAGVTVRR